MATGSFEEWRGHDKILIAIDFGTTQSGVTYSHLRKGVRPSTRRVSAWPGPAEYRRKGKVPTLLWYDPSGRVRSCGAEALSNGSKVLAQEEHWQLAEYFKLWLHPTTMHNMNDIPSLPRQTTLPQIIADWFAYLFRCTRDFFREYEQDGVQTWRQLESTIEFVIAHPDEWNGPEQRILRQALIDRNIVQDAQSRVRFVKEAEASVHFLVIWRGIRERLKPGTDLIVCDAGGSTVNIALYTIQETEPVVVLLEKRASRCVLTGGIDINRRVLVHLSTQFSAVFEDASVREEYLKEALHDFEQSAKRTFDVGSSADIRLRFGGPTVTHPAINLESGVLRISPTQMEEFFVPLVDKIIIAIKAQMRKHNVAHIMLFGGFGESPYLFSRMRHSLPDIIFTRANDEDAEVVSDGAATWYIQSSVIARAARYTYGIAAQRLYNSSDLRHKPRRAVKRKGGNIIDGVWDPLVSKDQILADNHEVRRSLWSSHATRHIDLSEIQVRLYAYILDDGVEQPYFVLDEDGNPAHGFRPMCVITADMNGMKSMTAKWGFLGRSWRLHFDVIMFFGATEFNAQIAWRDREGNEHRGPASVVPSTIDQERLKLSGSQ